MSMFEHKTVKIPDCKFCISPSQIGKFYADTPLWYQEEVLGDRQFHGNTATLLGTICHFIYDHVAKDMDVTREQIQKELADHLANSPDLITEVDINDILESYPAISMQVVNDYILPAKMIGKIASEVSMNLKIAEGIYLAGTCDAVYLSDATNEYKIVDYKTVAKKPSSMVIPRTYKLQLMAYAYMLRETQKVPVTQISIVYGIKPQKTIPARCIAICEDITGDMWDDIENTIQLIADCVNLSWSKPELNYLIFKDYRLKENHV